MKEGDKPAKQETVEWTISTFVYTLEALSSVRAVISCYLKSAYLIEQSAPSCSSQMECCLVSHGKRLGALLAYSSVPCTFRPDFPLSSSTNRKL